MAAQRTVTAPADQPTIEFTRDFDADVDRLFEAHVDPAQVAQWIGPRGTTLQMREFEARTGGRWSYLVTAGSGGSWGFFGSFHEVTAPSRIVQTFEFEGEPGQVSFEVLSFTDLGGGRSRLNGLSVFASLSERDAMLTDMDPARDEDFARLDELLASVTTG